MPGYTLSTEVLSATINYGKVTTITMLNDPEPSFILTKTDSRNGQPISGAQFTIEKVDNPWKELLTGNPFYTDSRGEIIIPNLRSGVYRVTETMPSNGFGLPTPNVWEITIVAGQDYNLNVKNTRLPSLVINKIDGLTFKGIPNTAFEVFYAVNGSFYGDVRSLGTFVTNKDGQIVIPNCQVGWYRYVETRPAPGYSKSSNPSRDVFLALGDNAYSGVGADAWVEANGMAVMQAVTASEVADVKVTTSPVPQPSATPTPTETPAPSPTPAFTPAVPTTEQPAAPTPTPAPSNPSGLVPTLPNIPKLIPTLSNSERTGI